jgi:hypothetical protein
MSDITQDKWKLSLCCGSEADVCKGRVVYILGAPNKKLGDTVAYSGPLRTTRHPSSGCDSNSVEKTGLCDAGTLLRCDTPHFTFSRLHKQVIQLFSQSVKVATLQRDVPHRSLLSILRRASSKMRRYIATMALFAICQSEIWQTGNGWSM